MSFNVNLASGGGFNVTPNMGGQPNQNAGQQPAEGSRVREYLLKFLGFGCAVIFTVLGFVTALSPFDPICILGGILQIIFGLLLMAVEAPFCYACCPKWEFVGRYEQFVSSKPLIVRSVVYVLFGVVVIAICHQGSAIASVLALWALAVYYGVVWWRNRQSGGQRDEQHGGLVNAENPSSTIQQPSMPNAPGGGYQPYSASY